MHDRYFAIAVYYNPETHRLELWDGGKWSQMADDVSLGRTMRGHRYKFVNGQWIFEMLDDECEAKPDIKQPTGTFDIREISA